MRTIVLAIASMALTGATEPEAIATDATSFDNPAFAAPPRPWTSVPELDPDTSRLCADVIREARDNAGLPQLDRRTASPENPELVWAVDHRRDGCGVLVMRGNPDDIRPVPKPSENVTIMPASGDDQN